jgi:hypothetical protein
MNLLKTPMPRVSCPNDENPENQANQSRAFLHKKRGVNQVPQKLTSSIAFLFMGIPDCEDLKRAMEEVNFRGT